MTVTSIGRLIFLTSFLAWAAEIPSQNEIGELDTGLEFFEFDLEDRCIAENKILWNFYEGSLPNLNQLVSEEIIKADILKKETSDHEKFRNANITLKKTARKLELLFSSGSAMMEEKILKELTSFAANVQATSVAPLFSADSNFNMTRQQVDMFLRNEKNASKLSKVWSAWVENIEKASSDLTQQISLLDLEADANGAESVEKYWLSISEITTLNYDGLLQLWQPLIPLYQKLQKLLTTRIATKFGSQVFDDPKLMPVFLLGSLDSSDWTTAADTLDVFKQSQTYGSISSAIRKRTTKDLYDAADEITAELQLGYLPEAFFQDSQFQAEHKNCVHYMEGTCKSDVTPKVLNCKDDIPSVTSLLRAHREVSKIKHHTIASEIDKGQGFLLREGPRDSVLYEAISTATSLLAVHPDNLLRRHLISAKERDSNMTSLLLAALHIIPPLPLHITYDLWRLQVLKSINKDEETTTAEAITTDRSQEESELTDIPDNTTMAKENMTVTEDPDTISSYDRNNLKSDWWKIRSTIQCVGAPNNKFYEDYLQDRLVAWNRPHISQFLGPILLFQILENFKTGNTTENRDLLKKLLQKGKSEPWENIVLDLFNITKLDSQPLVNYFKPLESFLDSGAKFNEDSASSEFSENNFRLFSQTTFLGAEADPDKDMKTASGDSNAVMIILVGLAVVGSAAVIISVVRRRLQRRRQAEERKNYRVG